MSKELPRHERRASSPTPYNSSSGNPFDQCDMSLKTLLGFISIRVLRGGPRLIIQLILAAFALLLLGKFFTSPASTDALFNTGSKWSWSPFGKGEEQQGVGTGGPGGLRVVAFGSPDIATPSTGKGAKGKGKGWTEMLCEELRCSAHQSFIPSTSLPTQAMTSNKEYRDTIETLASGLKQSKAPGFNYDFLLEQFPLSEAIADLKSQIDVFLAQPQPEDLPRETVWVFTFGTWDVWTLASLPRDVGQGMIDAAVAALFEQVERVYQASLDTKSVAYSEFWAYQDPSLIEKLNAMDKGEGEIDPREVENFRVIVPELFDVSLTPGWHAQRPTPPSPHTKAEQMTNAAYLTSRWNSEVKGRMDEWMRTADPQPKDSEDKGKFGYVPQSQGAEDPNTTAEGEDLRVPFPRRAAAQVDTASFVREAIIEKQMRDYELTDMMGRGNRTDGEQGNVFFAETWIPCIWAKTSETPEAAGGYAVCDAPGDYLFHSPFTLSERAVRETARIAAAETRSRLAFVDHTEEHEGEEQEQEKPAAAKTKRQERRDELRGFQRVIRPVRAMRLVDAACPTLDVC
ncbi:uncharacterized protein ColSpa_04518 [Colletotrichum spaethianum]|uniref:Uncharacterized protein n=1 Tax=Colletotrichum spaethianum TaxID=700344 RepID=A0AA37LHS3_9PEZI|nr:uncharacterized protein ColSpa_04518 [Colletotrichum spaethianum]GKT44337.1 hypothetical protein ColSpa_04518 [Colletotrichum spaethianum]